MASPSPRPEPRDRTLVGVLLAGCGAIAVAGGLVWSTVGGWDSAASVLTIVGAALAVLALALCRRAVFGTARGLAGVNTVLTLVLAVAAFALVSFLNVVLVRGGLDLTAERRFTLSDRSRVLLEALERTVDVTVVLSPAELNDEGLRLEEEIVQLVAQFARAARGRVTHRLFGGAEDESDVLALLEELQCDPRTAEFPLVVVRRGAAHRQLGAADFVMRMQDELRFRGEEALINAILEVTDAAKRKIYFSAGHGEGEIDLHAPGGYTAIRDAIERDYLETGRLHLTRAGEVPDDCAALVILGPRRSFTDAEAAAVEVYLKQGGRLFVLLESALEGASRSTGLAAVLARWGVRVKSGSVADPARNLQGNPHWVWVDSYGGHTIVNRLEHLPTIHVRPCPLQLVEGAHSPRGRRLHPFALMGSSEQSWISVDGRDMKPPAGGARGPQRLGVAVWEERRADDEASEARLVVLGDASFASNRSLGRFDFARQSHLDLFRNALNWLIEREARIAVRSRPYLGVRRLTPLDVSDRTIRLVMWGGMLGMPFLVLLGGVLVWLRRRK